MSEIETRSYFLPSGAQLGPYTIIRVLGHGGFGITYLAHDNGLQSHCVIKENLPRLFCDRDTATWHVVPLPGADMESSYQWALTRFKEEAQTLAQLRHPNIVRIQNTFEAMGTAYYVMELIDGDELHRVLSARNDEAYVQYILKGMLGALRYLHSKDILHRDIKPSNVLVTEEGEPCLIDFGTARTLDVNLTHTQVKSQGYTPMEQLQKKGNVGPWSDLYSLGATMVHALTGECPPDCFDRLEDDPYVPLAQRPEMVERYTPILLAGIDKALCMRPGQRWQTALEWLDSLDAPQPIVLPEGPDGAPVETAAGTGEAPEEDSHGDDETDAMPVNRRKLMLIGVLAVAVVAAGVVTWCCVDSPEDKDEVTQAYSSLGWVLDKYGAKDILHPNGEGKTVLHLAAEQGDEDSVLRLLDNGAKPDALDAEGSTPLHAACKAGYTVVAEMLVDAKASLNAEGVGGDTPLHLASRGGYGDTVALLLKKGANASALNTRRRTPLHLACKNGDVKTVEILLDMGASCDAKDDMLSTPLHVACEVRQPNLVELMVEEGASPNLKDGLGRTPLLIACQQGDLQTVKILLNAGAVASAKDKAGDFPLLAACQMKSPEMLKCLLGAEALPRMKDKAGRTPLHLACANQDMASVQLLLEAGADADDKDQDGNTPLHVACGTANPQLVQLLLDNGADPEISNKKNVTPEKMAKGNSRLVGLFSKKNSEQESDTPKPTIESIWTIYSEGAVHKLDQFVSAGGDINEKDKNGNTALICACRDEQTEMAQALISQGVDLSAANNAGETALSLAVADRNVQVIKSLVARGVNLNTKDSAGNTPLQIACREGELEIAQLLMPGNPDLSIRDKEGYTPLFLACQQNNLQLVKLLVEAGAPVNTVGQKGRTLLHEASSKGHVEIAQMLLSQACDVHAEDDAGNTPLHVASSAQMVKLLVSKGARLTCTNRNGETPLYLAITKNDESVINALVRAGASVDEHSSVAILEALEKGCSSHFVNEQAREHHEQQMKKYHFGRSSNTRKTNANKQTPLHVACSQGDALWALYLLQKDRSVVHTKDKDGRTPLFFACGQINDSWKGVITQLLDEGAAYGARDNFDNTPLHWACNKGSVVAIELLLKKGASTDIQNNREETPMLSMLRTLCEDRRDWDEKISKPQLQCKKIVDILIDHGADIDARDSFGNTALHFVCRMGDASLARHLVSKGAQVKIRNKFGRTPEKEVKSDRALRKYLKEAS